jgi:hypothetical protein
MGHGATPVFPPFEPLSTEHWQTRFILIGASASAPTCYLLLLTRSSITYAKMDSILYLLSQSNIDDTVGGHHLIRTRLLAQAKGGLDGSTDVRGVV